jgi:hypothetical protein
LTGRIRSIKPEWLEDELLAAASDEARVLSVGLLLLADDYGNGRASIATIAASVWRFALERDDGAGAPETLAKASRAFRELVKIRFIGCWSESGQRYFTLRNWRKHQRVDKPGKHLVPAPPADLFAEENEDSRISPESLASNSGEPRESLAPDLDQRPTTNDPEGSGTREGARPPQPAVDFEHQAMEPKLTICPLDLLEKAEKVGIVRDFVERYKVDPELIRAGIREFVSHWTIGAGMGRKDANWPRKLRGDLKFKCETPGKLKRRGPVQQNHGKTGTENARRL